MRLREAQFLINCAFQINNIHIYILLSKLSVSTNVDHKQTNYKPGARTQTSKVKSSVGRSLPVENLQSQNVESIINYLQ